MKIKIEIAEALVGHFSKVQICFFESVGTEKKVDLNIRNFDNAYDLRKETSSVKFDFFLISALVYGIDNLFERGSFSVDGWSRDFEVEFPVYNLEAWEGNEEILESALKFLSGDYWSVSFVRNITRNIYKVNPRRRQTSIKRYDKDSIKSVSLFSGGLDSLIGVIDELKDLAADEKALLVSHLDTKSAKPNQDQIILNNYLKTIYPNRFYWIQTKVTLDRKDNFAEKINTENNYRSRSLLFIGLGCYLSPVNRLVIPENGTISINYPLTPSRISSLSTRTTHPFVLNTFEKLLFKIGIDITLDNPYFSLTKGEMIRDCKEKTILERIYEESVSCGKRGHNKNWKYRTETKHCGVCMPCIYRRAALNKNNWDNQKYGKEIMEADSLDFNNDLSALISYLNRDISKEKMMRDLLVNGSIEFEKLESFADMVLRSREEVLQLFRDKAKKNKFLKSQLKYL